MLAFMSDGTTSFFTNVHASKIAFIWDGKKSLGQYYYAPTMGNNLTFFTIATVGNDVGVSLFTDENSGIENPKDLADLFVQISQQVIADNQIKAD